NILEESDLYPLTKNIGAPPPTLVASLGFDAGLGLNREQHRACRNDLTSKLVHFGHCAGEQGDRLLGIEPRQFGHHRSSSHRANGESKITVCRQRTDMNP